MSWDQLAKIDFLGTSPFQNLCCHEIRKFLPELEFLEYGDFEKTFVTQIPKAGIQLSLFFDSVEVKSADGVMMLEAFKFKRPEDLVARLIAELSNSI